MWPAHERVAELIARAIQSGLVVSDDEEQELAFVGAQTCVADRP